MHKLQNRDIEVIENSFLCYCATPMEIPRKYKDLCKQSNVFPKANKSYDAWENISLCGCYLQKLCEHEPVIYEIVCTLFSSDLWGEILLFNFLLFDSKFGNNSSIEQKVRAERKELP